MEKLKILISSYLLFFCFNILQSQNVLKYDLGDYIFQAQTQSPKFKLAEQKKKINSFQYLTYKSDLKPQISFYGNVPVYNKEYASVIQPDGTINFLPIMQNNSNIGLSLSQKIMFSGGDISLNTDFRRFDDFQTKYTQYNGNPLYIRLNQPLFGINNLKWQSKIEPLKLEESNREFAQDMEKIAQECVKTYFDALEAQESIIVSNDNLNITSDNYLIEQGRIRLGTTSEDKLLQMELQKLNNEQSLEKAKYDYQIALLNFKSLLGKRDSLDYKFSLPDVIPVFSVNLNDAINSAKNNRSEFIEFKRKKIEADRDLAIAKSAKLQVNLFASFGYNWATEYIGSIYSNAQNQQKLSIGFNIPIIDWGRRSAAISTAKSSETLTEYNNQIDEIYIVQELTTLVKNISLLRGNILLASKTDTVAQKRYKISNQLFQIGKVSVSELQIAQTEKDNARKYYISSIREFWNAFFLLRRLTLYDFVKNTIILHK